MLRRSLRRLILIAVVCLLLLWVGNAFIGKDVDPAIADPVSIHMAGIGDLRHTARWFGRLSYTLGAEQLQLIQGIDVFIGQRQFSFTREQFLRQWQIEHLDSADGRPICRLTAPPEVTAPRSLLPWIPAYINWPGDWAVFLRSMPRRLSVLTGLIVAVMILMRLDPKRRAEKMFEKCLVAPDPSQHSQQKATRGSLWLLAGAAVLAIAIVIVETIEPMYFSQGDVTTTELPHMLHGCRSMLAGIFPEWNAYQLLGAPTAAVGYWSLLYPPTYFAYILAVFVLGNENLTIEVFTIFHLALGYALTYWVVRKLNVRPAVAMIASLSFVLSGYSLIGGRSWHTVSPILVWMPLMTASLIYLQRGPVRWKWTLLTAGAISMFFYVGFTQFWAYAMLFMFFAVALLVLTGQVPLTRALWLIAAVLVAIGLSGPLVLAQQQLTSDIEPNVVRTHGIEVGLGAMVVPYPLSSAPHPNGWGNIELKYMTQMYYSGTLFCVVIFIAFGALIAYRWNRHLIGQNVWLICALLAFLLALGESGLLWPLITKLPILSKMRNNPIRMLMFFNLFAVLGGGLIVERLLNQMRHQRAWALGLSLAVSALLLYHAFLARPSFCSFGDKPYPKLPREMAMLD